MKELPTPYQRRITLTFVISLLAFSLGLVVKANPNPELMLASFTQLWGAPAVPKFEAWRALISSLPNKDDPDRLKKVNDFFNKRIVFKDSIDIWADKDYWPTPNETLGRGAANCTGYALAKYYSLRLAGVDNEKLRMVYVKADIDAGSGLPATAHMVVAYYPRPDAEPLILDNLIGDIRPAGRRPDLHPVFSFSEDGIFSTANSANTASVAGVSRYSKWEAYLKKAAEQGFR